MTAFIAIISGALMTELSTNFILSHTRLNRVANQATDNSAIELSVSRLQSTQLNAPCPAIPTTTVNNLTASATYLSCWPTVDVRSPQFRQIGSSSGAFNVDGMHASVGGLVYFADSEHQQADVITTGGASNPTSRATTSGKRPVVAGPVAFRCTGGCGQIVDYIYAIVSSVTSSRLVEYTYDSNEGLESVGSWSLPWANASGIAVQSATLPAGLAITFGGGGVALYRLGSNGPTFLNSQQVGGGVADAPYWCSQCNLFGVGAQNGGLYLFNSSLNPIASYAGTGSAINTTPAVDGAGDWYFGADDGYVHEVQNQGGQMVQVNRYGSMGTVGSSVTVGGCATGICVYLGTLGNRLYLVPLDARDAVLSACITSAPPTCSGANPRLWASVEVGASGSPQTVHVEGWSYYSG